MTRCAAGRRFEPNRAHTAPEQWSTRDALLPILTALHGNRPARVTDRLLTGPGPRDRETRSADVVEESV